MNAGRLSFAGYALLPMGGPRRDGLPGDVVTLSTCHVPERTPPVEWPNYRPPDDVVLEWMARRSVSDWVLEVGFADLEGDEVSAMASWALPGGSPIEGLRSEVIGYEVVGLEDSGQIHSWRCFGYEREIPQRFGWALNEYGLISTRCQADDALIAVLEDMAPGTQYDIPFVLASISLVTDGRGVARP